MVDQKSYLQVSYQSERSDFNADIDTIPGFLFLDAVPDGLTMDTSNRRLFYTDAGNRIIWGVDLDGRHASEEIINKDLENPRAIIAYPSKR